MIIPLAAMLSSCGDAPDIERVIKSSSGQIALTVKKFDLGSCCTNRTLISGNVFGQHIEDLAEIDGSGDIRYEWTGPETLSIVACNSTAASFRSGFQNQSFTRRLVLSVENERPREDRDRVICSSDRFERMSPL